MCPEIAASSTRLCSDHALDLIIDVTEEPSSIMALCLDWGAGMLALAWTSNRASVSMRAVWVMNTPAPSHSCTQVWRDHILDALV